MARLKEMLKELSVEITDEIEEKILKEFAEKKEFEEQGQKLGALEEKLKEAEESLAGEKLAGALNAAILKSNVKDSDVLEKLIDKSVLKLNDAGDLEGIAEQIAAIKKDKAYLFKEEEAKKEPYYYKPQKSVDADDVKSVSLSDAVADALEI